MLPNPKNMTEIAERKKKRQRRTYPLNTQKKRPRQMTTKAILEAVVNIANVAEFVLMVDTVNNSRTAAI